MLQLWALWGERCVALALGVVGCPTQDGYPRTIGQADALTSKVHIDRVVDIFLPQDVLIAKMLGRRTCEQCGGNFNVTNIQHGTVCGSSHG